MSNYLSADTSVESDICKKWKLEIVGEIGEIGIGEIGVRLDY